MRHSTCILLSDEARVLTTCPGLLHDSRMVRSRTRDPANMNASVRAFNTVSTLKEKSGQLLTFFLDFPEPIESPGK